MYIARCGAENHPDNNCSELHLVATLVRPPCVIVVMLGNPQVASKLLHNLINKASYLDSFSGWSH